MHFEVFAVEDEAVQVCWRGGEARHVTIEAAGASGSDPVSATVAADAGPAGAVVIGGLRADTAYAVRLGSSPAAVRRVRTLASPPGPRLSRFATINDMHIGARSFGTWRPLWDDDPTDPHPVRCLRAAVVEAVAWGAEAIVVKGDATQRGRAHEWRTVAEIIAATGLPTMWIEGNHETKYDSVDGRSILADYGLRLTTGTSSYLDLPGVRLIAAPTARWHAGNGRVEPDVRKEAVAYAGAAPGATVVILHHYPQRFRFPTLYPSGIPAATAIPLLDGLAEANPATLVLAGHSHRHRRHEHGPLVVAETGSTKDFPGTWSGYTVHSGGIMQTTRRVMEPSAFAWTERGRRVAAGVWGIWAPGRRSHRCFTHAWPVRP
ncbi:MAG: hypothetical protein NVS3B12_01050 [Acidimicrobiales bacterium]